MGERVYRVTVRGRFQNLSDEARRYLVREQAAHDIFVSAFTAEGTFTYDDKIQFFHLRYEVRINDESTDSVADPATVALAEATLFLKTMGFSHSPLAAKFSDTTDMWDGTDTR